jgi:hypothetical protein
LTGLLSAIQVALSDLFAVKSLRPSQPLRRSARTGKLSNVTGGILDSGNGDPATHSIITKLDGQTNAPGNDEQTSAGPESMVRSFLKARNQGGIFQPDTAPSDKHILIG